MRLHSNVFRSDYRESRKKISNRIASSSDSDVIKICPLTIYKTKDLKLLTWEYNESLNYASDAYESSFLFQLHISFVYQHSWTFKRPWFPVHLANST